MSGPDRQEEDPGSSTPPESKWAPPPPPETFQFWRKAYVDTNDSFWARLKNDFNKYSGRFSNEQIKYHDANTDWFREESDCKSCEQNLDEVLKKSAMVTFMMKKIKHLGGELNTSNIVCRTCPEFMFSGFDPDHGIVLCANRTREYNYLEDALSHELIHAYDHLRFRVDWDRNLKHAACTEIRASSLSGECRFANEFFRNGFYKLGLQHQACVRRRAILSVLARPACKDETMAAKAVNDVWDSCFADTRPFDEIYR